MGMGGVGRRQFPWTSYSFPQDGQWGSNYLAECWTDFAGEDAGIVMSLWDLSRMLWLSETRSLPPDLGRFLGSGRNFYKWGYVPVDSTGPDEMGLPVGMVQAAAGYDRLLAASEWGAGVVRRTRPVDWIPHGIWMDKFRIYAREDQRALGANPDNIVVGCNMANQSRKDWPVAFEAAAILRADLGNKFRFWVHTDTMIRYYNLYALATDYGVADCLEVTTEMDDAQLALRYSACDCTILPSAGEGFGFPIAESMACGTPCVVTDYAAGQELVEDNCKVPPVAYRVDTVHDVRRAVLSGYGFASRAKAQIEAHREDWQGVGEKMRGRVEHLGWDKLKHVWMRWFREGLA
jgi:glycosyltransferase involved in cell wall biosynthesis